MTKRSQLSLLSKTIAQLLPLTCSKGVCVVLLFFSSFSLSRFFLFSVNNGIVLPFARFQLSVTTISLDPNPAKNLDNIYPNLSGWWIWLALGTLCWISVNLNWKKNECCNWISGLRTQSTNGHITTSFSTIFRHHRGSQNLSISSYLNL